MDDSFAYKVGGWIGIAIVIALFWSSPIWMACMALGIAAAKSSR